MKRRQLPKRNAARAAEPGQPWRTAGICLALAAITFAVFGQTLNHGFFDLDDGDYVFGNPMVAHGLTAKGIAWAFTRSHARNWHPLTWLSHMLDCQFYGLNPGGHHLTNVLVHSAAVILLFLVLRQMTGAFWRSAFIAAVFAIHPLRVESVAWVAERKDVLSGLFFFLTIGAYVRYARRPWSPWRYGLVAVLFALGLMCKPMLVTLPLVLLLLDYWPLRRMETRKLAGLALEKLPLLALSAAGCAATLWAQNGAIQTAGPFLPQMRLGNALTSGMVYLGQMFWPAKLAVFYPYPRHGHPGWELALAGILLAAVSAFAWRQRRAQPWLLVGWLWYWVMLLPVLGIIQVGLQAHADRYTYLPQIGVYLAVTWLVAAWVAKRPDSRAATSLVMAVALGALAICSWKQTDYWKDNRILWAHTVVCTTDNAFANYKLGTDLAKSGSAEESIPYFRQAAQIDPNYAEAHLNLGNALLQTGSVDEGIAQLQQALQLDSSLVEAHNNLGIYYLHLGRVDEAIAQCRQAVQSRPDLAQPHNSLGNALTEKGLLDEAIAQYQMALQIDPSLADAANNLGNILMDKGNVDEAIACYQKALAARPGFAAAQSNLEKALQQKPNANVPSR